MVIDNVLQGIERKGHYEVAFDILNPQGPDIEYSPKDVREIVKYFIGIRNQGWMHLKEFSNLLHRGLSIYPKKIKVKSKSKKFHIDPIKMSNMAEYWNFCYKNLKLNKKEISRVKDDRECTRDPQQLFLDLFGGPSIKKKQTRIEHARNQPYDGSVIDGYTTWQSFTNNKVINSERCKILYRTFQKIAQKVAEIEAANYIHNMQGSDIRFDLRNAIRNDPLGMKLIVFDEKLLEVVHSKIYTLINNALDAYLEKPYCNYSILAEPAEEREHKGDNATHIDIIVDGKPAYTKEIILTSKFGFWKDEFCGVNSHISYMFRAQQGMKKEAFMEENDIEKLTNKLFNKSMKQYRERVRQLRLRGNEFIELAHEHAMDLLLIGDNRIHFYYPKI